MSAIHDLTKFLLARYDEDEAIARSGIQAHHPGQHWQWVVNETDELAKLDGEYEGAISLRTVEEFPTSWGTSIPVFIIDSAEVGDPEDAVSFRHIARHDPARVLADVEAKREIVNYLNIYRSTGDLDTPIGAALLALGKILAKVYAAHPDYDEAWRT